MKLTIKRIYEPADAKDDYRILVDRIWPRGLKKSQTNIDLWLKEIAPSTALRKVFNHMPDQWKMFQKRYHSELNHHKAHLDIIKHSLKKHNVTLLYSAKDEKHNQAVVLAEHIRSYLSS